MIKHRFARGEHTDIVDVCGLNREDPYRDGPYFCYGCGNKLVPRLGHARTKHFSHKHDSGTCSLETYLHRLAKMAFYSTYNSCIGSNTPFCLRLGFPAECTYYKGACGNDICTREIFKDIDLTTFFPKISLETSYNGCVPDILLASSDGNAILLVEIAVTHQCADEKISLNERILELHIQNEEDVQPILNGRLDEQTQSNISTHNFTRKSYIGNFCNGDCPREITIFKVYSSEKSILATVKAKHLNRELARGSPRYTKIVGFADTVDPEAQYPKEVQQAFFNGVPITNCYLCRYHGIDGVEQAVFCKFRKQSFPSHEALECSYYRPFRSRQECESALENNERYLNANSRRRVRSAIYKLFEGNLSQ